VTRILGKVDEDSSTAHATGAGQAGGGLFILIRVHALGWARPGGRGVGMFRVADLVRAARGEGGYEVGDT